MTFSPPPTFSIIIPCYNEEKNLFSCLKAVFNQTLPKNKYEVIVVDNASTDKTHLVAKKFPVRVIKEPIKGLIKARTAGLKKALGKYIINLDADCLVPKDWLKKIYRHFQKDPQVALVTGPYICLPKGKNHDYWNAFLSFSLHIWNKIFKAALVYYGGNVALKKSLFLKIGGYDFRFPIDQLSIIRRVKKAGARTVFDQSLKVYSSPRRTQRRWLKFLFQEAFFLYFFNNLYIKITGKSLGSWEDIR